MVALQIIKQVPDLGRYLYNVLGQEARQALLCLSTVTSYCVEEGKIPHICLI